MVKTFGCELIRASPKFDGAYSNQLIIKKLAQSIGITIFLIYLGHFVPNYL
ncbi:protein of unknown function [Vibrio tapetis subsp. tapetis]|uniref:Uncharacterized protein n=1 Tax=Vibrio tapetis subsp. tapetis TaxID=1671868 RepID=A0A2N8ZG32_9VIBR|nr:protein of unknown function [Vibrio tapetis subsp. tapetis]